MLYANAINIGKDGGGDKDSGAHVLDSVLIEVWPKKSWFVEPPYCTRPQQSFIICLRVQIMDSYTVSGGCLTCQIVTYSLRPII